MWSKHRNSPRHLRWHCTHKGHSETVQSPLESNVSKGEKERSLGKDAQGQTVALELNLSYLSVSIVFHCAVLWIQGHNGPLTKVSYYATLLSSYYVLGVQDEPLGLFIIKPSIVV